METIISITTDAQGASVVSARELYDYLEIKKQFADWIKSRIEKYGLVENQDYMTFSLFGEKGRPSVEYALTIDAAKELAMVEGNARGKQARQYFIECEKSLRQLANPAPAQLSTDQVLLHLVSQQTQLLTNQQAMLDQLRSDVEQIKASHHSPFTCTTPTRPRYGQQLGVPGLPPGKATSRLRQLICQRIAEYSGMHGVNTQETWTYLYKRLLDVYGINAYRLQRGPGESMIDAVERYGHLDRLDNLIRAELAYRDE